MLTIERKTEAMQPFQQHERDTGSAGAQIALLTSKIEYLQGHFAQHKKDKHSLRGLLMHVQKRRKLLNYLKNKNIEQYRHIKTTLKIRH